MARLSANQCQERITKPINGDNIRRATHAEQRLVMHCEAIEEENGLPTDAWRNFLRWVKPMLESDKFDRFKQFVSYPLPTVDLTESIFDELSKVNSAQDRYIHFDFASGEMEQDFIQYQGKMKDEEFFSTNAIEWLKTSINSIIVIDLPQQQSSFRPEPYYYMCPISSVHDIGFNPNTNAVEYIIINRGKDSKTIIDDEFYRIATKNEQNDEWAIQDIPHSTYDAAGKLLKGLGYCPAIDFYGKPVKGTNGVVKKGPITKELGRLDDLLFTEVSAKYLKAYGAWPIIVSYRQDCTYKDDQGQGCEGGRIKRWRPTMDGNGANEVPDNYYDCPSCKANKLLGAGSHLQVDAPAENNEADLMDNPIKFIEMSNEKLEFANKDIDRQGNNIFINSVGYGGDVLNEQAVNDNQVSANFESKESVLDNIRSQFERCYKFAWDTICKMRYGMDYKGSVVDLGSEYYLKSVERMNADYKSAKDNGMPQFMITDIRQGVNRAKYKNNAELMLRANILSKLEPYADFTPNDLTSLLIPQLNPKGYVLKVNFDEFINRFELENGSIVQFGSLLKFNEKISIIKKTLDRYVGEQIANAGEHWNEPGGTTEVSPAAKPKRTTKDAS